MEKDTLIYRQEVYTIIGAAIEVHRELGHGFLEAVYEEAMAIESARRKIPFETQVPLPVRYKGLLLKKHYIADYIGYGKIIVEFKSVTELTNYDQAQIIHYLKVTGMRVGLLINFGSEKKLEWSRFAN